MGNVLNRTTKEYRTSVSTPRFPVADWIHNPVIPAEALSFASKYWDISGDTVSLMSEADRNAVDDQDFLDDLNAQSTNNNDRFGNAVDGDTLIDTNTTLDQDLYADVLTVEAGVTLTTAGFRIFARKGVHNAGTIAHDGTAGSGSTAGTGPTTNVLRGGANGGAGGNPNNGGNAGGADTDALILYGGAGGTGGTGDGTSGGNGGAIKSAPIQVRPHRLPALMLGIDFDTSIASPHLAVFWGGSGGGGGGGDGVGSAGGGGGGGGGVLAIAAPLIFNTLTGIIRAAGGDGASQISGNVGGGAGGGGGLVLLAYTRLRNRGSIAAPGGIGGNGAGTGANGQNGNAGRVIELVL